MTASESTVMLRTWPSISMVTGATRLAMAISSALDSALRLTILRRERSSKG